MQVNVHHARVDNTHVKVGGRPGLSGASALHDTHWLGIEVEANTISVFLPSEPGPREELLAKFAEAIRNGRIATQLAYWGKLPTDDDGQYVLHTSLHTWRTGCPACELDAAKAELEQSEVAF